VRLKLWDEQRGRLVTFREANAETTSGRTARRVHKLCHAVWFR